MPRVAGIYQPPNTESAPNPVVEGTPITDIWANTTIGDLGSEITNSLSRDGSSPMTGQLKLTLGSVGAPALTFQGDTATGLSRTASGEITFSSGGTGKLVLNSTGITVNGSISLTGLFNGVGVTGDQIGRVKMAGISQGTSGSISVSGTAGGYAGINFPDVHTTLLLSENGWNGIYRTDVENWRWAVDGSGRLMAGKVPWSAVEGGPSVMSQIADDVGYVRYNASTTFTQPMYFNPTGAWNTTAANPVGGIIAQGLGGGGAAISFHRPGAFGINVGLDTDNYFRIGGWSSPPDLFQLNVVNGDVVTKGALYVSGGTGTVVATNFNGNATSATRASYLKASGTGGDMVFSWSDPGGVPNYLWGGSDGVNMRVVNINNFIRSCYNINVFQGTNTGNGYSIVGAALDNMGDGNIRLTRTYYYAPVPNPGSGGGY